MTTLSYRMLSLLLVLSLGTKNTSTLQRKRVNSCWKKLSLVTISASSAAKDGMNAEEQRPHLTSSR